MPPPAEEVPPHLNFAPLQNASDALTHSAERYQKALEKVTTNGELAVSPAELQALNQKLMQSERKLTSPEGLPGRPWFQHLIYAPGHTPATASRRFPASAKPSSRKSGKRRTSRLCARPMRCRMKRRW